MIKRLTVILICIFAGMMLNACCLAHEWEEATCTEPRTCKKCGATEGEPLGHDWKEATCTEPQTCIRCGETYGEPLGHDWKEATCTTPKTCMICGATEGGLLDHVWLEATCQRPRRCAVCGLTEGEPVGHTWVKATYDTARHCSVCGMIEGEELEPAFEKRGYEFTIEKGSTWDYTTLAYSSDEEVTGTATIKDYRKYYSDAEHPGREGYEWREVTVEYRMPKGCRVMWGYTDTYSGLEEYASGNFITYPSGYTEPVRVTEAYKYDWEGEECVSDGNLAVQVPEDYEYLVFYVCNADYSYTHRIDPNIKFMDMN
ncbi:MAG: hypothetical protein K6G69_06765 [Lachnospiraceae bacterium]|nr:hypothetical protein [Lachnospiraceae bacterium]